MNRIEAIKNRKLSNRDQAKIDAMAKVSEDAVPEPETPKISVPDPEVPYVAGLVEEFYSHFSKNPETAQDAAALTLSACILKAGAVVGLSIKGLK